MKCGHQQNELEAKIDGNQVMTLNILVTLKMKDDDEMIELINTWKRKLDDCLTIGVDINQKLQRLYFLVSYQILGVTLSLLKMEITI